MFAGADSPVAIHAAKAVGPWSQGQAVVVGQSGKLNPPFAAMVNGASAHALDFDDFDEPANAHPSAVIFPALLALASERPVTGTELLDAHIMGVEVIQRLGEAMNMDHYLRGWLSTLTLGTLAAAAACARLARSMGTYRPERFAAALAELGDPWSIVEHGLITKAYPTCGYAHRIIDAAVDLSTQLTADTASVCALDISVPDYYLDLLVYDTPETAAQAMFSAPYNVASALVKGRFDLDALTHAALTHPEVTRLTRLASVTTRTPQDPALIYDPKDPDTVSVTLNDGRQLTSVARHITGSIHQPLSVNALRKKFSDCLRQWDGHGEHDSLWSMLLAVEELQNLGPLLEALALPARPTSS